MLMQYKDSTWGEQYAVKTGKESHQLQVQDYLQPKINVFYLNTIKL